MNANNWLLVLIFWPMAGAIISYIIGRSNKNARDIWADIVVVSEFILMFYLAACQILTGTVFVLEWNAFCGGIGLEIDGFRAIFGTIAAFMWLMTTLYSKEYMRHFRNRNRYYLFTLLNLGATMGVFLSKDLYTTFIFFEIMSLTSYVWVVQEEDDESMRAGGTYLAVAILGGLVMLMGIFMLNSMTGTLTFSELPGAVSQLRNFEMPKLYISGALILFGFGAKAGMFPIHIWLPKTYTAAPAPASALLSGILSKSGLFGIIAVTANIFASDSSWGLTVLILGTITMVCGAVLAVFSVNVKRILACSSMSQIGFIIFGIGLLSIMGQENVTAADGVMLHMVNHSMIKLVLFMIAGVVYMNTHKLELNEIRGYGRKKPLLMFCFLMGALSISGIPMWSGYISKTLLHESIVNAILMVDTGTISIACSITLLKVIEWLFIISGGMTLAYMTKLFLALFVEKNTNEKLQKEYDDNKKYWNNISRFTIAGTAVVLTVMGFFPYGIMGRIAEIGSPFFGAGLSGEKVRYFSWSSLKGGLTSIVIGIVIYFVVIRLVVMKKDEDGNRVYVDRWPKWLDIENVIYRPVMLIILPTIGTFFSRIADTLIDGMIVFARKTTHRQMLSKHNIRKRYRLGVALGKTMDWWERIIHRLGGKDMDMTPESNVPRMIEWQERTIRISRVIQGSLNFGLIMASAGLVMVLIYLLFI